METKMIIKQHQIKYKPCSEHTMITNWASKIADILHQIIHYWHISLKPYSSAFPYLFFFCLSIQISFYSVWVIWTLHVKHVWEI